MSAATTVPTDVLAHAGQPVGSARAVLLTVLGDAVLPTGGSVWLATLTAVASDLGIQPTATRQALRRLVAQELVTPQRHGRLARYELTPTGRRRLEEAAERIYLRRPLTWNGRWHLLSWPRGGSASAALRRELGWLGYGELDDGTWCCPWDLGTRLDAVLAKHDADRAAHRFTAALDGDDRELADQAYDLRGLREAHRSFLSDADALAEPADDRAALVARLSLVHRWRKLLFLDPGLPTELLPADWLGDRAGAAFVAAYRALEAPAWRHYLAVAAVTDPAGEAPPPPTSNLAGTTSATGEPSAPATRSGDAADARRTADATRAAGALRAAGDVATDRGPDEPDTDDPGREREFLALLHGGRRIEPSDWMPSTYRRLNIRFIEMHANSEIMGALPEREWIARAPSLRRKRSLAAKVQDEVGHAHLIYRVAESLGRSRAGMYEDLIAGRGKFHNVFHYPTHTWGDVACIGFLVDGAAIVTQRALLETSYAPYVRVMRRVVAEESLHYRHGEDIMLALASGSDEQFEMLQEAVLRWWEPVMHFFGTDVAREDDPMIHWGVKTRTNEQSRQEWIAQYVPKLWDMGIETPDPALAYDPDTGRWTYTEPDWDRLRAIIKGEPTPTTATRLHWRQLLHRHHAWVRRILLGDAVPAAA
jgi:ring-1,2-phenylacetyl-CoA epoxidase subunit PaaA